MTLPSVTITIPTYARVRWLEQALCSALAQQYDGEVRILVFNDCPRQQLVFDHPRVRIANVPQSFTTLGGKRNAMSQAVDTEWIALLDDDDFLLPWHCSDRISEALRVGALVVDPTVSWYFQKPLLGTAGGILVDMVMRRDVVENRYPPVDVGEDRRFRDALRASIGDFHIFDNRARPSYVYCWGNGVYHLSGQGDNGTGGSRFRLDADARMRDGIEPTGRIELRPKQGFDPAWAIEAMKTPFPYGYSTGAPT